jgi:hypothetical protein
MSNEEFQALLAAAQKGDVEAMAAAAIAYAQGDGVAQNSEQMLFWLKKAEAGGHAGAQEMLTELFKVWKANAEQGDGESQIMMVMAYLQGIGTAVDYAQAEFWARKSAAQKNIKHKALGELIIIYAQIMLPARNFRELLEGAQKGNANLQYGLGFAYLKGFGTAVDGKQAAFWLEKAANNGHPDAKKALASLQLLLAAGVDNFDNIAPVPKASPAGLHTKHQFLYIIISMLAVSYIATGLNIGWLHSFAILANIGGILTLAVSIIGVLLVIVMPKRAAALIAVVFFISGILTLGFGIHYIKGRKAGNPVSIVLQNPFEAARKHFFGKDKKNAKQLYVMDVKSENGAAKIFQVHYGKEETVISLIRTTGSHKAIGIATPGEANSFYVQDKESGKTWPLKETRLRNYEEAAGVDLVFDPFRSRSFDLIEGKDKSKSAWHFRDVNVIGETQ